MMMILKRLRFVPSILVVVYLIILSTLAAATGAFDSSSFSIFLSTNRSNIPYFPSSSSVGTIGTTAFAYSPCGSLISQQQQQRRCQQQQHHHRRRQRQHTQQNRHYNGENLSSPFFPLAAHMGTCNTSTTRCSASVGGGGDGVAVGGNSNINSYGFSGNPLRRRCIRHLPRGGGSGRRASSGGPQSMSNFDDNDTTNNGSGNENDNKKNKYNENNYNDDDDSPKERWRQRGMSMALSSTYFAVMGAKCALPSVLSLLTSTKTGLTYPSTGAGSGTIISNTIRSPQILMARLLGISTLSVALGKLLLGPVIDKLGGIRSLQIALISLTSLVLCISVTQQFTVFACCWVLVDFIFSSCWAGCINAIHQSFPKKLWGKQIGLLAAGARMGNAAAFALFATVLYSLEGTMRQPWRIVFAVAALLQLLPISLLTYFGGITLQEGRQVNKEEKTIGKTKTKQQKQQQLRQKEEEEDDDVPNEKKVETKNVSSSTTSATTSLSSFQLSIRTLQREAKTVQFWLHLLSRSTLMVYASFLLFVPTLMKQVYMSSNAFAAQSGSIFALGCLMAVTFGSDYYSKLSNNRYKQAMTCFILLVLATISSLIQLAHVSGVISISCTVSAMFLFLWGFSFAIPFYIPPSLYALSHGGKNSSATIVDIFDIGGFVLLAIFNSYVASIQHAKPEAWIRTFQLTTACSVTSLLSLTTAILKQIKE